MQTLWAVCRPQNGVRALWRAGGLKMSFAAILFATFATLILFVGATINLRVSGRWRFPALATATMMIQEVAFFITMLTLWKLVSPYFK